VAGARRGAAGSPARRGGGPVDKGFFDFARYGSIGISWVLTTSIYLYLGYKAGTYLDQRLESSPLFLLLGIVLAIGLSFRALISEILALTQEADERKRRGERPARDRENGNNSGPGRAGT